MRFSIVLVMLTLSCLSGFSQTYQYKRYQIRFTDKNNSPYTLSNPSAFLSDRALQRRAKQHIPLDEKDLPVTPRYVDSVAATGVKILNGSKWLNSVSIYTDDSLALLKINSFPFVKSAKPAGRKQTIEIKDSTPMISSSARKEESVTVYGSAAHQIDMLNGVTLHRKGYRGEGIIIAMLDAGFFNVPLLDVFDSLVNENRILYTYDFVSGNTSVFEDDAHGSACLSTIAANQPGIMVGTAPKASFLLLRTEESGSEYPVEELNWAAAAEFADSAGADIISSSLGYTGFDDSSFNYSYADMNGYTTPVTVAATVAASKGMIVCSSAGNSAWGSPMNSWYYISAPADAAGILTVGAVDENGYIASFSSRGPTADGRIKPDVVAQGERTVVAYPWSNTVGVNSGTSFSCPVIAGMAACLWQAHPEKTSKEIIYAIKQSASFYTNPNNDYGYGIPNFSLADLILSGVPADSLTAAHEPVVFPNPFSNNPVIIYFSQERSEEVRLDYYDMQGRWVNSGQQWAGYGVNQLLTDFSGLPSGSYFIRISSSRENKMMRVVKVNTH